METATKPSGPFQYYQAPSSKHPANKLRTFSERAGNGNTEGLERNGPGPENPLGIHASAYEPVKEVAAEQFARRQRIQTEANDIPSNLRAKAWSPEPSSPRSQPPQRYPSNASAPLRKGSVSDRGPLQKLEAELASKEHKRARAEQAERKARPQGESQDSRQPDRGVARTVVMNREKGRVVSDGNRRPDEPPRKPDDRSRQVSAGNPDLAVGRGGEKLSRTSDVPNRKQVPPTEQEPFSLPRAPVVASDPRMLRHEARGNAPRDTRGLDRPNSEHLRQSWQHDGGSGDAAATPPYQGAAARGKAAHERRKSLVTDSAQISPPQPQQTNEVHPAASKKYGQSQDSVSAGRQNLRSDRTGRAGRRERDSGGAYQDSDQISPRQVATAPNVPVNYSIPPQTTAGQKAREQVGFSAASEPAQSQVHEKQHRFGAVFHHRDGQHRSYEPTTKPMEEWRHATVARLTAEDLELEPSASSAISPNKDAAWWENNKRNSGSSATQRMSVQYDGPYEEESKQYRPQLFATCGPLLRYTGIRREQSRPSASGQSSVRESWRGSILLVTDDVRSDYSATPSLRIFAQPMDLHTPSSKHMETGQEQLPEHEDPVAGQVKLSRTGRPLYVRPVHDLHGEIDLSREENPQGLYSAMRTPVLGPQSVPGPDGRQSAHITFQDKSRIKRHSGEKTGRFREVNATRLHVENGWTFWRFNIEIELGSKQHRVAYRINKGPAIGFWVPARGETMNMMFHSCNGFSLAVDSNAFSGPDPLWRDVLNKHQSRPFHVMIGGGDQIYNDAATRDTQMFREWLLTKNPAHKYEADFTPELQSELEQFYLERYAMWFSQGLFAMANSQIPMVNLWDDHDIIDGFGSYPHHFMSSRVFTGVGAVAFKYYMLFQHQSLAAETQKEEPSWLLGASPGPYINERSRSIFLSLGRRVAFLGLDCRTERMRDEILSQDTYDIVFDRLRREIVKGETRHLVVLLGVPIAYPRLNFLENILTSRVMDPIKAVGRTGALGGFVNKFDGGVEILDDLDDHWTAKHHKGERNWLIQELQELAADLSVRVTILGGDVHLGAVGQFYTPKKFGIPKDKDHRYMPNIISSAIVNTPPPTMMADVLNKRNKVHHLDEETDEDMIPMFDTDVDGSKRNNKHLLPRRNYCTICEFEAGTPPPSPKLGGAAFNGDELDRRFPPGSMRRTMSLTRNPAMNLVRRLSNSGRNKNPPVSLPQSPTGPGAGMQRSNSLGDRPPPSLESPGPGSAPPERRPSFHRRPTNLSEKQAKKAAALGDTDGREPGHIDLEYGLDVSLNMEFDQKDPGGSTVPYRLLVPALWYDGAADINTLQLKGRRPSLAERFGLGKPKMQQVYDDYSPPESPVVQANTAYNARISQPQAYEGAYDNFDSSHQESAQKNPPTSGGNRGTSAWNEGYRLSGPPLGARALPAEQAVPRPAAPHPNGPYGHRRSSAPQQQRRSAHFEQDDERSLTPESLWSEQERPARRPSKAERFFGIAGDTGGNARRSLQAESANFDDFESEKKPAAWKIWKR